MPILFNDALIKLAQAAGGAPPSLATHIQGSSPHPPGDLVEIRVRSGSGRILHRHLADTQQWALPGGEVTGTETPQQAAARSLAQLTGYEIPAEAMTHEATEAAPGGPTKHVYSVAAGAGRQVGKPSGGMLWMKSPRQA